MFWAQSFFQRLATLPPFSEPKKLVAFVGIAPSVWQSGEFVGTQNKMSKRGSLICVGQSGLQRQSLLSMTWFSLLFFKRSEEKQHDTAIGAAARKLTCIIYAVLRDKKPYVPNC